MRAGPPHSRLRRAVPVLRLATPGLRVPVRPDRPVLARAQLPAGAAGDAPARTRRAAARTGTLDLRAAEATDPGPQAWARAAYPFLGAAPASKPFRPAPSQAAAVAGEARKRRPRRRVRQPRRRPRQRPSRPVRRRPPRVSSGGGVFVPAGRQVWVWGWRRCSGWCRCLRKSCGSPLLWLSAIATLGTELEVELKKLRVRHRRQRGYRYDAWRGRGDADRWCRGQLWIRRRRKFDLDFPGDTGQCQDRERADRQAGQPGEDHHDGGMTPAGAGGTGVAGGHMAPHLVNGSEETRLLQTDLSPAH
jgi:hypothetical protein